MRGRCSKLGMEIEKNEKATEEQTLSGAYIRSLVKHLTSSRAKDESGLSGERKLLQPQPQPVQTPPRKKQARKRHHTSKPYQERLLNMAEARREIATALKIHRAAMKQQQEQQQQQQKQQLETQKQLLQTAPQLSLDQDVKLDSWGNSRNDDHFSSFPLPPYPVAPPLIQENLDFPLPNQTLGLNLNIQDFNNLDATPYFSGGNSSIYSSSSSLSSSSSSSASSSSSSCPSISIPADDINHMSSPQEVEMANSGLHPTLDDKEMAEIRSIGEQHQMELNDTLNLATSAWWFKFLKTMKVEPGDEEKINGEDFGCYPFDEITEFPAWLSANESCFHQHLNDQYSEDPALPWMGIEEIEGKDVEWMSKED